MPQDGIKLASLGSLVTQGVLRKDNSNEGPDVFPRHLVDGSVLVDEGKRPAQFQISAGFAAHSPGRKRHVCSSMRGGW